MPQALEFHQLDRRLERLRVRHPASQRRLIASLAETGQQTPIIVIQQQANSYLVIDGHKRINALQTLGRDTVQAVVWDMSEADALLLARSLRMSEPDSALEQGWLLSEREERLGYTIDDLAKRFDRSASWVARRMSLVETLPQAVQQQVREGRITAQIAMRYLVPVARVSLEQCLQMANIFANQRWTTRQAAAVYNAWRHAKGEARKRILANPELFLKTQQQQQQQQPPPNTLETGLNKIIGIAHVVTEGALQQAESPPLNIDQLLRKIQYATGVLNELAGKIEEHKNHHAEPGATHNDSGTPPKGDHQARDRAPVAPLAPQRAQGAPIQLKRSVTDRDISARCSHIDLPPEPCFYGVNLDGPPGRLRV